MKKMAYCIFSYAGKILCTMAFELLNLIKLGLIRKKLSQIKL